MNKFWFKPKSYGYGLTPITWEGWLCTLVLVVLIFGAAFVNDFFTPETGFNEVVVFVMIATLLGMAFTFIFKGKTDGEMRWRWGEDKDGFR